MLVVNVKGALEVEKSFRNHQNKANYQWTLNPGENFDKEHNVCMFQKCLPIPILFINYKGKNTNYTVEKLDTTLTG